MHTSPYPYLMQDFAYDQAGLMLSDTYYTINSVQAKV